MSRGILHQIERKSEREWHVTRVISDDHGIYTYELIGRIVCETDGQWKVDVPKWCIDGYVWHERIRRWQTFAGARRELVDLKKKSN